MTLAVDVISDVICPWCFIGKRRLEKAIAAQRHDVRVRWHAFQLNPAMPKEGISHREYRTKKFGSWERSQELDARLIAVGKEEGITGPRRLHSARANWDAAHAPGGAPARPRET
jgi:predicted DsbA family dithiol-disulfide isomerase